MLLTPLKPFEQCEKCLVSIVFSQLFAVLRSVSLLSHISSTYFFPAWFCQLFFGSFFLLSFLLLRHICSITTRALSPPSAALIPPACCHCLLLSHTTAWELGMKKNNRKEPKEPSLLAGFFWCVFGLLGWFYFLKQSTKGAGR